MAHIRVMSDFLGKVEPERRHSLHILLHHDAKAPHLHPALFYVSSCAHKELRSHDKLSVKQKACLQCNAEMKGS